MKSLSLSCIIIVEKKKIYNIRGDLFNMSEGVNDTGAVGDKVVEATKQHCMSTLEELGDLLDKEQEDKLVKAINELS